MVGSLNVPKPAWLGWTSGDYKFPIGIANTASATPSTTAHVVAWRFTAPRPTTFQTLHVYQVTAQTGGKAMAGLYSDNGSGRPGTLAEDLGTLDLSNAANDASALSWAVTATMHGNFWVLIWLKGIGTQVTVKSKGSIHPGLDMAQKVTWFTDNAYNTLRSLDAYPGSMPSTAPTMEPIGADMILPMLRAA